MALSSENSVANGGKGEISKEEDWKHGERNIFERVWCGLLSLHICSNCHIPYVTRISIDVGAGSVDMLFILLLPSRSAFS